MTALHRFQIDLTKDELDAIERLGNLAALRTKKEVILNALTLFRWAAKEILYGRTICSIDERTQAVKQLEIPALSAIYETRDRDPLLTPEQVQTRLKGPSRPFAEFDPRNQAGGSNVASVLGGESGKGMDGILETGTGQS